VLWSVHTLLVVHHVFHAWMDRQFGDQPVDARHGRHMPQNAIDVAGHDVPAQGHLPILDRDLDAARFGMRE
jgi:hypothetical protein